jgi:hypothetical protein
MHLRVIGSVQAFDCYRSQESAKAIRGLHSRSGEFGSPIGSIGCNGTTEANVGPWPMEGACYGEIVARKLTYTR